MDRQAVAQVLARVRQGNFGDCKALGDGVFQLRVAYGPGYRIYFGQRSGHRCGVALRRRQTDTTTRHSPCETVLARIRTEPFMKAVSYTKLLQKRLKDPEQAAEYLTACYEEGPDVFLLGLRDVVEAQGGVGRAARLTHLNRENLYRLFSRNGNPRLSSLNAVLAALGLKVSFEAAA